MSTMTLTARRSENVTGWIVPAILAVTIAALVIAAVTTQGFMSFANAKAILASVSVVGILGVGMTAIMISGAFVSLSLGITAAISAMIFIWTLKYGLVPAVVITLICGALMCAIQGYLIGEWSANPIILTIAAGALQTGVAVGLTEGAMVRPVNDAYAIFNSTPFGIPLSIFILLAFVLVVELILKGTLFGRRLFMLGESRAAARAMGMPIGRLMAGAFAIAGVAAGVTGVVLGSFNQGGSMLLTGTLTFDAIAATLVGGTVVSGGRGAAWRTLLGALAIGVITNILLLRGYSTGIQIMVKGLIVVIAVVLVHVTVEGKGRR